MSSQAPPPSSGALSTGPSSQPLTEAARTSSRDPVIGEARAGSTGGPGSATTGALGVPSNGTANEASDNVEKSSKRSLTGRRREGSTGSKRSNRQAAAVNEKAALPGSSSGAQATQPKPKKKGFLSFLACCSAPDDSQELGSSESAQPAKTPASKLQPTRAKPPPQVAQAQNASATNTSADGSKEVIDEKAGQPSAPISTAAAAPVLPTPPPESEKPNNPHAAVAPENPVPTVPVGATAVSANPESRPLETDRQQVQPEQSTPGPAHLDTSQKALAEPSAGSGNPLVNVTAPTPVVPQQDEGDAMILDRTPEQAQRDTDIEMTDNGPSLPLSTADVAAPESEKHGRERRDSDSSSRVVDLPPPPPLAERQAQVSHTTAAGAAGVAGAGALAAGAATAATHASSERTSLVSTPEQNQRWLLPAIKPEMKGRKCLVLDLDETLVHSSFKILHQADFTIPVEIEGQYHNVYVIKRPGVDAFLKRVGEIYEVVVFTASVSKYGDPLLDQLDISGSVHHRLFRESCYNHQGNYVKDLSQVGRPLEETIIIDNSPTSYIFHPQHAVPISSWFSDAHDNELPDLIPFLEDLAGDRVRDVSVILDVAL